MQLSSLLALAAFSRFLFSSHVFLRFKAFYSRPVE